MTDLFFYIFSAVALISAFTVVFSRNTVNAAMALIVTFLSMASLFVLLEAYFLAVVQVLVYAGAVVVLFLFIVMLLDAKEDKQKKISRISTAAAVIGFAILVMGVVAIQSSPTLAEASGGELAASQMTLKTFGNQLFTTYLLPMQVTGFLLLIAMVGVIVISKKAKQPQS
ncbi:NADH-quinone oxidoreductase subunit J [Puniceicoccaceae bacterium K14]|nr:NADH-quinone oxidoreductase subunit J [Puniceicoccaceae bacterium K14]